MHLNRQVGANQLEAGLDSENQRRCCEGNLILRHAVGSEIVAQRGPRRLPRPAPVTGAGSREAASRPEWGPLAGTGARPADPGPGQEVGG